MKIIKRKYLQEIINVMGTPDIKVITGVRRSGKSQLLNMFMDYVKETDKNSNIIFIDYNLDKFDELKQYKELINYINERYDSQKNNYLMIDEVQMCDGFTTNTVVTVYGTYQHATSDLSLANSKSYSFSSSGLGKVLYYSNSNIRNKYDNMQGIKYTFSPDVFIPGPVVI